MAKNAERLLARPFGLFGIGTEPVTPLNYSELCEGRYAELRPNKQLMRLAHFTMAQLYKPGISFDSEAAEMIQAKHDGGEPMILSPNHDLFEDQYLVGAAMHTQPSMRGFIGSTVILSKAPYSATPFGRAINEAQGSLPVFRQQDLLAYVLHEQQAMTDEQFLALQPEDKQIYADKYKDEIAALSVRTGRSMLHFTTARALRGEHLFIFAEGTRNKDPKTWRQLQKLEGGIGSIACAATRKGAKVAALPIGISYKTTHPRKRSHVHIGRPIESGVRKDVFMERLESAMQRSLDTAYAELDKEA